MTVNSTKIQSLPGRAGAFVIDVKEITDLRSEFFYNFYKEDETNENIFEVTKLVPDSSRVSSFVKINFEKPNSEDPVNQDFIETIQDLANPDVSNAGITAGGQNTSTLDSSKIVFENDLGGNFFTGLTVGLPNETSILRDLTKEASSVLIDFSNSENVVAQSTTEFIQSYSNGLKENGFYFSEAYKEDLPRFFKSISNENLGREENTDLLSYLNYSSNVTYFSSILQDVGNEIVNNSTSVFANSVENVFSEIVNISSRAKTQTRSIGNPMSNYFPTIESSKIYDLSDDIENLIEGESQQFKLSDQLYNGIEHVGYVVRPRVITKTGNVVTTGEKLIIDPDCQEIYITNPPYGSSVGARISAVYAVKIPVYRRYGSNLYKTPAVIFIAGKGRTTSVSSVDTTPPPPPQDLTFNLTSRGLEINWSLPFNKQRDISKFRIFKRRNKNEPFSLIKQIDFGGIKDENIPSFLNELSYDTINKKPVIKTHFIDREFDSESDFIYAITCVDVHDLTSNYSEQMRVKINPVFNRLEVSLFARIGAYIQYPNMTLETEVFEGVVKSSGYNKAKIYFNPDFLRVYKEENGGTTDLININPNGDNLFKLNLINIDLQEQQDLDIIIGEGTAVFDFDSRDSAIVKSFLDEDTSLS